MEIDNKPFEKLKEEILNTFYAEAEKLAQRITLSVKSELQNAGGINLSDQVNLQRSISAGVNKLSWGYLLRIFSGTGNASVTDEDTKPFYFPVNPLMKWVNRKGLTIDSTSALIKTGMQYHGFDTDKTFADKIARKIYRKGTQGKKFFEIAFRQALPKIEFELQKFHLRMA